MGDYTIQDFDRQWDDRGKMCIRDSPGTAQRGAGRIGAEYLERMAAAGDVHGGAFLCGMADRGVVPEVHVDGDEQRAVVLVKKRHIGTLMGQYCSRV